MRKPTVKRMTQTSMMYDVSLITSNVCENALQTTRSSD